MAQWCGSLLVRLGQQGLLSPRSRAATSYAHGTAAASTGTPDPCLLELSNHNWYDECDPGFGGAATSSPALSWDAREAAAPTDHHHECLVVVSHKLPQHRGEHRRGACGCRWPHFACQCPLCPLRAAQPGSQKRGSYARILHDQFQEPLLGVTGVLLCGCMRPSRSKNGISSQHPPGRSNCTSKAPAAGPSAGRREDAETMRPGQPQKIGGGMEQQSHRNPRVWLAPSSNFAAISSGPRRVATTTRSGQSAGPTPARARS